MRATDRPVLGLTDDSIVNFNININPIYPVFLNAPYNAGTFDETVAVGTVVYSQVTARDGDLQVTTVELVLDLSSLFACFTVLQLPQLTHSCLLD